MKRKVDWIAVIEQALGGVVAAVFLALISIIYQAVTHQRINYWIYIVIGSFFVIMLFAVAWKFIGRVLSYIGNLIIRNSQIAVMIILTVFISGVLFTFTIPLLSILIPPSLVLITFFLTKKYLQARNPLQSKPSNKSSIQSTPSKLNIFSQHLDDILESKRINISGPGLRFLNNLKNTPPFLDLQHKNPAISLHAEQALTEYFRANDFIKANSSFIRGGIPYTVKNGDTWESIAEDIYGDPKFVSQLKKGNPGAYFVITGSVINTPFIHITNPDWSSYDLERKIAKSKGTDELNKAIILIQDVYGLVDDEKLPLLISAYEASQKTQKNSPKN